MSSARCLLAVAVLAVLSGCASLSRPQHVARPGYQCSMPPNHDPGPPPGAFNPGSFSGYAVLDAEGRQEHAEWRWSRHDPVRPPWSLHVMASSHDQAPLTMDHARASLEVWRPSREGLRLQLARSPDSRVWLAESSSSHGIQVALSVPWSELLGLSREAPLTLLLRADEKVVERWTVDPALIETAAREIEAGLAALAERTADYRTLCDAVEDLDPEPIIVT